MIINHHPVDCHVSNSSFWKGAHTYTLSLVVCSMYVSRHDGNWTTYQIISDRKADDSLALRFRSILFIPMCRMSYVTGMNMYISYFLM